MATFLNHTADDLNLPELGLTVKAGETVEVVDPETIAALSGHPHFDPVEPQDTVVANTQSQVSE